MHPKRAALAPAAALAVLAALAFLLPCADARAAAVTVRADIVYGAGRTSAGSEPLKLDLYRPAGRAPKAGRPVVVLIHGGGFRQGARTHPPVVRAARALAARGIVAASIGYRLLGSGPVPSARVRPLLRGLVAVPMSTGVVTAVDDTLTAIGHLRANARRLGIDADRLGLVGLSAGAVTADHVGYVLDDFGIRAPRVRFVASLWGGILVAPPGTAGTRGIVTANQLERGEPALFAVHGDADPTVPVALSDQLAARATSQGVPHEYHRIPGGTHGWAGAGMETRRVAGGVTPFDRLLRFAAARLRG